MPVGVIAAGVGAAATIGGALITSGANKSAANTAANAQQQASTQQTQLVQNLYNQNAANEQPYINSGYAGQAAAMQLLGLQPLTAQQFNSGQWNQPGSYAPVTQQGQIVAPAPTGTGSGAGSAPTGLTGNALWDAYLAKYPDVASEASRVTADGEFPNADAYAAWHYQHFGATDGHLLPTGTTAAPVAKTGQNGVPIGQEDFTQSGSGLSGRNVVGRAIDPSADLGSVAAPVAPAPVQATDPTAPGTAPAAPAHSSITDIISQTPGYQYQLDQALDGVNSNAYARGIGNSGATYKALEQTAGNLASNYYQQYLNNVLGVAAGGAGAAGALAGVSQNYGNSMSSIYQNNANSAASVAAARAGATGNLATGIASGIGTLAGAAPSLFGSSYKDPGPGNTSTAPYMPNYDLPVTLSSPAPMTSLPGGFY